MEFYIDNRLCADSVLSFIHDLKEKGKTDIHSIIFYKDNTLMLSLAPSPYSSFYRRQVYSVSKTLSATAIGILYDMGLVHPNDKLCDIFSDKMPSAPSPYLKELTVKHLLTMTAGHETCSMKRIAESSDGVSEFLKMEIVNKPGTSYLYDTGASYMLAAIVSKLTSLSLFDFLYIHLFNPLKISPAIWPFSGGKVNEGGLGMRLSADDYAKISLMYMNNGVYEGRRILSADWINQSFSPQSTGDLNRTIDWRCGYGYQFWNCSRGGYRADGAFGQYSIIDRENNQVLLLFGESCDVETELDLCFDFMEAAFNPDTEREHTVLQIKETLENMYLPHQSEKAEIPVTCYRLNENTNGFTLLNISCNGDALTLNFSDGQAMRTITAGNGEWIKNSFLSKRFMPQLCSLVPEDRCDYSEFFASYSLVSNSNIEVLIKFTNNPHTAVMKISFSDALSLEMNRTVSPDAQEAFILTGTKA